MKGTETTRKASKATRWFMAVVIALSTSAFGQNAQIKNAVLTVRPHRVVLVSLPDRQLAVLENGTVVRTFNVAVGAKVSPSPTGEFQIVTRITNPTYYHSGVVIPPGSGSPVGPRWVGLNKKGYGIHGTNEPRFIGKARSHGCIRLNNRDIQQFFELVSVGDTVEIRGERDQEVAKVFGGVKEAPATAAATVQTASLNLMAGGQ